MKVKVNSKGLQFVAGGERWKVRCRTRQQKGGIPSKIKDTNYPRKKTKKQQLCYANHVNLEDDGMRCDEECNDYHSSRFDFHVIFLEKY